MSRVIRMRRQRSHKRRSFSAFSLLLGFAISLSLLASQAWGQAELVAPEMGTISGRVFDSSAGTPIEGATIILAFPDPGNGEEIRQEVASSGPSGDYEFDAVPVGAYGLSFIKSGYRASSMTNFKVKVGQDNVADFPMPRVQAAASTGSDILELDAFVVEASVVGEMMDGLELRLDSDQMLNILSAEDLSKYAASDVADALKRVAGVNIVEGQFAVVRGLEDRYTSTLFNGAPIPSPDPNSQSVQLDLFPSDVVTNLVIAKTFAPASASNSAAGSINIMTQDYPEELEFKISLGAGFEEGSRDRFVDFKSGSPAGEEASGIDVAETDFGLTFGGRVDAPVIDREIRFKGVFNHEVDYRSQDGFQETLEPRLLFRDVNGVRTPQVTGDLALGELSLSDGLFEEITSTREEQLTASFGFGFDWDDEGKHRLDFSTFYTNKKRTAVRLRENGYFSNFDYSDLVQVSLDEDDLFDALIQLEADNIGSRNPVATSGSKLAGQERNLRTEITEAPQVGALWFSSFGQTTSFETERELEVYQFNGGHDFDFLDGLEVNWATNFARTTQQDDALGTRFFYEPCGYGDSQATTCPAGVTRAPVPTSFPVRVSDLGVGSYLASNKSGGILLSSVEIDEVQWFGRLDFDQDYEPTDFLSMTFKTGVWWEKARRSVESSFLENATVARTDSAGNFAIPSPTLPGLGQSLFGEVLRDQGLRQASNRSRREVTAGYFNVKATLWEDLDLIAGFRIEELVIGSLNEAFTGVTLFSRPAIFPSAYLFLDRIDNSDRASPAFEGAPEVAPATRRPFNDQVLGIPGTPNESGFVDLLTEEQIRKAVTGDIEELNVLPSATLTYRPLEGVTLRASYSETVARPSLREVGYYASVEPGTDEQFVGNPLLTTSDVQSIDGRFEYVFGDLGDLIAFSAFYKVIDRPIESIIVRDAINVELGSEAFFRTFFNNPSTARLFGIEVEARKSFDFLRDIGLDFPGVDLFEYLSVGGNYTYIDARVKRSPFEIDVASDAFVTIGEDVASFTQLKPDRRLFGQPKWIVNADISYNNPDWGTTVTLAFFAISDILDAAGTTALGANGAFAVSNRLDRYIDEFHTLDLVMSQRIWQGLNVKMSIKNLTDSTRRRIYDQDQTNRKFKERLRNQGRDYSFAVSYSHEF